MPEKNDGYKIPTTIPPDEKIDESIDPDKPIPWLNWITIREADRVKDELEFHLWWMNPLWNKDQAN